MTYYASIIFYTSSRTDFRMEGRVCVSVSGASFSIPADLGIVDAQIDEDSVWSLPRSADVSPGKTLIVRNKTEHKVTILSDPHDKIDDERDVLVSARSSMILTALGDNVWKVLITAPLNIVSAKSDGLLPGTPTEKAVIVPARPLNVEQGRRVHMPMTKVRGLIKKI